MAHLNEHELLHVSASFETVIHDWTKFSDNKGQVDTFIIRFTPLKNSDSLKVHCSIVELVET